MIGYEDRDGIVWIEHCGGWVPSEAEGMELVEPGPLSWQDLVRANGVRGLREVDL